MSLVTLLTDFGDVDGFVGAMRGVLHARAPGCVLADLAHHVPPGDVAKAARVLCRAAPCFPIGTVHLVVVDPGVGSARRPLAVRAGGHLFVAPDNGVLGLVVARLGGIEAAHVVSRRDLCPPDASVTFHGRDVFAPTAAVLAAGCGVAEVGPPAGTLVALPSAPAGSVVEVDHFGNLVTDLPPPGGQVVVGVAGVGISGPSSSYAAVPRGELVLVVGSEQTLEVAVRDGSAAERLGIGVGAAVSCTAGDSSGESADAG